MTGEDGTATRPRVLLVGRTRYTLPLPPWLAKKFEALERQLDFRVLAAADPGSELEDARFRLLGPSRVRLLDGVLFYVRLVAHIRRQINQFRPDAIVAESPYTAAPALLARLAARGPRPRVIVEVHGDWRTATRLYGSRLRIGLAPLGDTISRLALRRSDAVRALSPYTETLVEDVRGIPVTASFPTYSDLAAFTREPVKPLPDTPTALFVGMLEAYKNIDGLAAAWRRIAARVPDARLVVVGKGPRRRQVEALVAEFPGRVEHVEALPPGGVAARMDEATVFVLPSRAEGLGRVIIESFARGRAVVAARGGGVPDLVTDGVEGILVEPGDDEALADAVTHVLTDPGLAARMGEAAHRRYGEWHAPPAVYAARVRGLVDACLRDAGAVPGPAPRVLLVGAGEYDASGDGRADRALRALQDELDLCVLGRARRGAPARRTVVAPGSVLLLRRWPRPLDPIVYGLTLPVRIALLVRRFRPDLVIAESPYIGFAVLVALAFRRRPRPSLVIEAHSDWRLATRLRGSRIRVLIAPVADLVARYALRRADALRTLSPFTAELAEREAGVPPLESFPAYIDLAAFGERPVAALPSTPTALFVGALERSKNIAGLADAWPSVAARVPGARLVVVGRGALVDVVERLRDDFPTVVHLEALPPHEVARRMDQSTCLVVPSRSEGLGRVVIESFARGRGVVASDIGGLRDLVDPGVTGLLVQPDDTPALADAIVAVLTDHELAERLGAAAREVSERLRWTPDDYAVRVRSLVDRTLGAGAR